MDLTVLNTNLLSIAKIDTYESLIWTERYSKCGDFELYMPISGSIPWYLKLENMLINKESEYTMIIESIETESDSEKGDHLKVTGRSLESILDRRIIWGQQTFNGNLQDGIKTLIDSCFINPTDSKRKVENFVFEESTDTAITELTFEAKYLGDNLLDVIEKLCNDYEIGYKITLDDEKQFVFKLYAGVDRSYSQIENPYVVFSPEFDNVINSNYITSSTNYKNVVLVAGSGEGADRVTVTVGSDTAIGLERRELFTDAGDVSQTSTDGEYSTESTETPKSGGIPIITLHPTGAAVSDTTYKAPEGVYVTTNGNVKVYTSGSSSSEETTITETTTTGDLTDEEYRSLLIEKGGESLSEHTYTSAFEGQIDITRMYKYREDFFDGDIVQLVNEYGNEGKVRIVEMVMSVDEEGFLIHPTFSEINEKGDTSE